jgi:CarD family transcriptional regulator
MQFKVGDQVVYPGQGVAVVRSIEDTELMGSLTTVVKLSVLGSDKLIMIPVSAIDRNRLRPVISRDEVDEVFDILRERNRVSENIPWNRRYRNFVEKINRGNIFEIAEVYRDLTLSKSSKQLSFGERRLHDTARRLLVQELGVAQNIPEEGLERELDSIFA